MDKTNKNVSFSTTFFMPNYNQTTPEPYSGLHKYIYHIIPVVTVFGLFGNALALMVLLRERFRKLSTVVYLLLLALCDSAFLLLKLLKYIADIREVAFTETSWAVKVHNFFDLTLPSISNWTIVLLTLERLLYASLPIHISGRWCTQRTAIIICILMIFGNVISCLCIVLVTEKNGLLSKEKWSIIGLVIFILFVALPCISIIIFSGLLVYYLFCVKKRFSSLHHSKKSANVHLTGLIITNIVVFLILNFPVQVFQLVLIIPSSIDVLKVPTELMNIIFYIMTTFNKAINPYMYAFSGSLYKQELILILGCKIKSRSQLHSNLPPRTSQARTSSITMTDMK